MQIVCADLCVVFPRRTAEPASPSVRLFCFPDIIIPIGRIPARSLLKPPVLVRCMVDDQIHNHAEPALMCLPKQAIKIFHCAKLRMNCVIVADIVSVVDQRRRINRTEPDHGCAEASDIVEPLYNSAQIANPIPVAVLKAPRIDLIYDSILPPFCLHCYVLLFVSKYFL